MFHSWLTIPFFFLLSSSYTNAFTWKFTSQPSQCQNVSVAVQGLGQPPYSIVIIPVVGPSSLVPGVQNIPFPGSNTSLSFQLNYPANSSFIAVVCLYPPPAPSRVISLLLAALLAGQRQQWFWHRWY